MKIKQVVQLVIIAVLITALVIGNVIVFEPQMESNITGLQAFFEEVLNFHPFPVDSNTINEARKGGQELSEQIIKEGSVLVKNNGVLPLNLGEVSEVNVFGHAAIDWVYGGSGSGQVLPENNNPAENTLGGLGENAALNIIEARNVSSFFSVEDLQIRAKLTKSVIDILRKNGVLNDLSETDQLSMF